MATKREEMGRAVQDPRRMVKIKLFKDSERYREPLFVGVNDYHAVIPRGVEVEVPFYVAKHLEEMQQQDSNTATLLSNLSSDFDAARGALGE